MTEKPVYRNARPQVGQIYDSIGRPPTEVDHWVIVGVRKNGRILLAGFDTKNNVVMVAQQPFNPSRRVIGFMQFSMKRVWEGSEYD